MFMSHSWATQGNAFVLFRLQKVLCILQLSTQGSQNITPTSNEPLVIPAPIKSTTQVGQALLGRNPKPWGDVPPKVTYHQIYSYYSTSNDQSLISPFLTNMQQRVCACLSVELLISFLPSQAETHVFFCPRKEQNET